MIRHLTLLIWNRRHLTSLLALEVLCSFLVLFAVVLPAVRYAELWRQPLGFDIDDVWAAAITRPSQVLEVRDEDVARLGTLLDVVGDLVEVEAAAGVYSSPYTPGWMGGTERLQDGRLIEYASNLVTDALVDVLDMTLVAGRWFSPEDDAVAGTPVIVNRRMAREVFGDDAPVGRRIGRRIPFREARADAADGLRVVGVIEDYRPDGELSPQGNHVFRRMPLDGTSDYAMMPNLLLVRAAPGTTAAFEETLVTRLQRAAPEWSFQVEPLADARLRVLSRYTTPLIALGTVTGFLLLMVALGLVGVVWQSVTQRTCEFGLRRANGATGDQIRRQVLTELLILTSAAVGAGVLLVAQLPAVPMPFRDLVFTPGMILTSVMISGAAIYLLTLLCGWIPSRLATSIPPAEALRHE